MWASVQSDLHILCLSCILQYPLTLLADNEGPDKSRQIHKLIRACIVCSLPKALSGCGVYSEKYSI